MIAASENKRNTYKKTLNFDKNEVFSNTNELVLTASAAKQINQIR